MKVALINLPNPALAEPWSNFPLGLGYVAAAIEQRGYNVQVLDWCEDIPDRNRWPEADVYGMQITAPQVDIAKRIAESMKYLCPDALVVAGGPQVEVDLDTFLIDKNFDSVVVGEGEFSFYECIRQYQQGKVEPIYWNPPIKLLDDIPFPARHLFPNYKTDAMRTHQLLKGDYCSGGQTTIIASRGCPYRCSFCAPHPHILRFRSPLNVIEEIIDIYEQFDIRQFKWQDDTFTLKKKWVLELCEKLVRLPFQTYHRAHSRVDVFDEDMAAAMSGAGFKILCFGIESFSQQLLDNNAKHITIEQIENAFRIAKKYGFKTVGFLIFGMPGENEQTVEETKQGILRNKQYLDYLNLATMVPLLGTPVQKDPDKYNCEIIQSDQSKHWIVDHETSDEVLVRTKGVPLEEMKRLKVDMYQFMRDEGYSRPEWKQ